MQRNRLKKTVMEKIVPFDIRQIVQASELADGTKLKTRKFASGPKSLRQGLLQSEPDTENGEICAALEIQRVWRGYRSRCKLFEILQEGISEMAVYGGSKHYMARQEDFTQKGPKKTRGRQRLEQFYQDYLESLGPMALADNIATFQDFCANYIQNWYRAKKYRKPYVLRKGILPTKKPAVVPKEATPDPDIIPKNKAAIIIQRAWRRHIDMQVYKYYRDLINFKTRGDPSLMLRCINPNEAKLLDPALGVHVRFRLAGMKFPPNIYYKIFTHRPIVDMCANSPKDYTRATAKQVIMRDVHNNTSRLPPTVIDKDGWYQRVENNGWRLVSDRLITHIMNDPLTWESSQKRIEFHHTKLQRKQDVEKKKKHKKIQWMKKMYKDGLLKAKSHDPETVQLIEGAAAGMVSAADRDGPDALEEWEVDELLDWTTSLNFEEYMVSWKEIATSANSENSVEERLKVTSDNMDPYELTVSMDASYRYSARQSAHENTPASSMTNLLLHV